MKKPVLDVALALVQRDQRWLVAKRLAGAHLADRWEFPGGKLHRDETPAQAALRELAEECAVAARVERVLDVVTWEYEDRIVRLTPVLCRWLHGEPQPLHSQACCWVAAEELRRLDMPPVNATIIRAALTPP